MILVDTQIRKAITDKKIGENFDVKFVQPASYDLRVGPHVYTPEELDHPIDLSRNGGVHRIPPYGLAVLQTYETFTMPKDWVGRFGLKSKFTRRGLIASTGPQIDPGWSGKLIVSLWNHTPRSQIFSFKEKFLTVEFHKLETVPEGSYQGEYQDRQEVGADVLSDLVRTEGLSLSHMHAQFTELTQHVKEWSQLAAGFNEFVKEMRLQREAMAILAEHARPDEEGLAESRQISHEEAKDEVLKLFKTRSGQDVYYSDAAEALKLDFATVIKVFKELEAQGDIKGTE